MPFPGVEIPFIPVEPGALPNVPGPPFEPRNTDDCLTVAGFRSPSDAIRNEVMLDGEAFMTVLANFIPFITEGE